MKYTRTHTETHLKIMKRAKHVKHLLAEDLKHCYHARVPKEIYIIKIVLKMYGVNKLLPKIFSSHSFDCPGEPQNIVGVSESGKCYGK